MGDPQSADWQDIVQELVCRDAVPYGRCQVCGKLIFWRPVDLLGDDGGPYHVICVPGNGAVTYNDLRTAARLDP